MNSNNSISKAVKILCDGGLVAFPTETVYGLGADAMNSRAAERIFQVKKRPRNHPLIVHVSSIYLAKKIVINWPKQADAAKVHASKLADFFLMNGALVPSSPSTD